MTAPYVSGHCGTEELVRAGVMASTSVPEHFHSLCPGATTNNGRTILCTCPHHADEEVVAVEIVTACGRCGYARVDSPRHPTENGMRCDDVEACNTRYQEKLESNPAFREAVEFRERMETQRLEIARAEYEAGGATATRARYGRCEWSGEPTRGGRFQPGNDAKLKGRLIKLADSGSVGAMAELLGRGWVKDPARWPGPSAQKAESALADDEEFVAHRVEARWKRIEDGASPEEAVR